MNSVSKKALDRLLELAENASAREASGRSITLRMTQATFKDYLAFETRSDLNQFHGDMLLAEKAGCVQLEWNRGAGDKNQLDVIKLVDAAKLAEHLGVKPRWQIVEWATAQFAPHVARFDVLNAVLDGWKRDVLVRNTKPSDISDWLDAVKLVAYCQGRAQDADEILRPLSILLFGDSKRIEKIWAVVDVVAQNKWPCVAREEEEVLAELGILKYHPLFQISATGDATTMGVKSNLSRPVAGLVPEAIDAFGSFDAVKMLLSVENLTTFNEVSRIRATHDDLVIVYTAGMPSPTWLRVYGKLLDALPPQAEILHWGDIDAGGFRIASKIAYLVALRGRRLGLHLMHSPKPRTEEVVKRKDLAKGEVTQILKICEQYAWKNEAAWVESNPKAIEQEHLLAELPARA